MNGNVRARGSRHGAQTTLVIDNSPIRVNASAGVLLCVVGLILQQRLRHRPEAS